MTYKNLYVAEDLSKAGPGFNNYAVLYEAEIPIRGLFNNKTVTGIFTIAENLTLPQAKAIVANGGIWKPI